jgi:succinyl-CoA synthetase beta subunit
MAMGTKTVVDGIIEGCASVIYHSNAKTYEINPQLIRKAKLTCMYMDWRVINYRMNFL